MFCFDDGHCGLRAADGLRLWRQHGDHAFILHSRYVDSVSSGIAEWRSVPIHQRRLSSEKEFRRDGRDLVEGQPGTLQWLSTLSSHFLGFQRRLRSTIDQAPGGGTLCRYRCREHSFYTNYYTCNYVSCTNYSTSTHFMGQFGAGLKLYARGGLFVRPELHYYLVNNNQEYTSSRVFRYGASIGYTFGAR